MDTARHGMGTACPVVPGAALPAVISGDNDVGKLFCQGQDSHPGWACIVK